jgi:hypothetical protein
MFFVTSKQSRDDAKEIGAALGLSGKTVETINSYPLPELMDPKERSTLSPISRTTKSDGWPALLRISVALAVVRRIE